VTKVFAAVAVLAVTLFAGETPARHSHYLHALSDLRYARFLLNHPKELSDGAAQKEATAHIDRAITEIKRASIDDHKGLNDHPPADRSWDRARRLRRVTELLESAMRDLNYDDDEYRALNWRNAALQNVRDALDLTRKTIASQGPVHHY
jgi:hypothetical protein